MSKRNTDTKSNEEWLKASFVHYSNRDLKREASSFHRSWMQDPTRTSDMNAAQACWAELDARLAS